MLDEERDVVLAGAQRRNLDRDDVEAIVEVFAEATLRDQRGQIAVRSRDDAHVDLDRLLATHTLERLFFQRSQHLGLRAHTHVADLVQEERAAFACSKRPRRRE